MPVCRRSISYDYCAIGGRPVLASADEAWWVVDGKWRMLDADEAFMNGLFVEESEFRKRFGILPALPNAVFSSYRTIH
jgi:hypothetical protein